MYLPSRRTVTLMNLYESVNTLQGLLSNLNDRDASFAASLISSYKKYKGLTPKQEPWIGKLIAKATTPKPVFSAPVAAAPVVPVNVGNFAGVIALFAKAKEHLKFPKITLVLSGQTLKLSLLGLKSKNAGSVNITDGGKYPLAKWFGRVSPEGTFIPSGHNAPEFTEALTALLTEFSKHPARIAKEHGKLTGLCCFCNKVLGKGMDKRSIAVGFGPDCAEHYGLKEEWKTGVAKAEANIIEVPTLSASIAAVDAALVNPYPADEQAIGTPNFVPVVPTLTVTPEAQAVIEGLAADLAKSKDVVGVDTVVCYLCEEECTTNHAILHGKIVCPVCVKQLNGN